MSAPEICPRCGSPVRASIPDVGIQFECATIVLPVGGHAEGMPCVMRQRDQLAERVKHLMWIADGLYDMATESGWESTFQRKFKELKDTQ